MTNKQPWTSAQIEKECPVKLQDLGKRINVHLAKAAQCDDKAEQHRISAGQLLAEAKAACDGGGFNKFRELCCPNLGKSRAHELLQIASGKKTIEETKTATRERVKKHRSAKGAAPQFAALQSSVTVTDDAEASAEKRKAEYAASDGDMPKPNEPDTEVRSPDVMHDVAEEISSPPIVSTNDENIPIFLDRRPFSPEDQCAFGGLTSAWDAFTSAWEGASGVVRARFQAEVDHEILDLFHKGGPAPCLTPSQTGGDNMTCKSDPKNSHLPQSGSNP